MKILHKPGSIQAATEDENRDADLAQIASMVDFLCILADVPTEDEAGRWSKAMLKILVQRKPQRLTEAEYTEITGEQYAGT